MQETETEPPRFL